MSRVGLDLLPQAADVRTDNYPGFSLAEVVVQGGLGQLAAREDGVGMLDQMGQQRLLAGGKGGAATTWAIRRFHNR